jgi:hypothetical protein
VGCFFNLFNLRFIGLKCILGIWLIASSVITEENIRWAVNDFGSYKTAGEDGIFPVLLQQGIENLGVPLCKVNIHNKAVHR